MKILSTAPEQLTNAEVLAHLKRVSPRNQAGGTARPAPQDMKSPNFATIVRELTEYLTQIPADADAAARPNADHPLPPYNDLERYSPDRIRSVMQRLERFKLTKAELLMVLNLRPRDPGLLDAVVEECDDRFGPDEQEEMLKIIGEELGE